MISKREKQRRHDSQMPRINTLRRQHNTYQLPYRNTNKWRKYYGSKAWINLRRNKLMQQPLCERCLTNDKITTATQVHHVNVYGSCPTEQERWYWFLKQDNLMSLCNECHKYIHATNERGYVYHWPFDDDDECGNNSDTTERTELRLDDKKYSE